MLAVWLSGKEKVIENKMFKGFQELGRREHGGLSGPGSYSVSYFNGGYVVMYLLKFLEH